MKRKEKIKFAVQGVAVIGILCFLLQIKLQGCVICLLVGALLFPGWIKIRTAARRQETRLGEASLYMEQLLYAFYNNPKLLSALEEIEPLFEEGDMKESLREAITCMHHDYASTEKEALDCIEQKYPNDRMKSIHAYLLRVEQYGGDYDMTIDMLLEDLRKWLARIRIYQADCMKYRRNVWVAVALSFLVCAVTNVLLPKTVAVGQTFVCQAASVLLVCVDMAICRRTDRRTGRDWLKAGYCKQDKHAESKYRYMQEHHNLKALLYRRSMKKSIEWAFPQWLMELSLLLQTENVQVALYRTKEDAPDVLRPAIEELMQGLQQNPESMEPYMDFLKEYQLADITSAMRMLYALSNSGYGNSSRQLGQIMIRNQELMDKAERLQNEDALAGLYTLFLAPALTGAGKMMVDMTAFLIVFMSQVRVT